MVELSAYECKSPSSRVHKAIYRPKTDPDVPTVTGSRSHHSYRVIGENTLAYRPLSCFCRCCQEGKWAACKNKDTGKVQTIVRAASKRKKRGQRSTISVQRQNLAKSARAGSFVALQAADDEDGFTFWIAKVVTPGFVQPGHPSTETEKDGVMLRGGGMYISVNIYDRYPSTAKNTFREGLDPPRPWTIDAEGVIRTNIRYKHVERRFTRRKQNQYETITIGDDERDAINEAAHTILKPRRRKKNRKCRLGEASVGDVVVNVAGFFSFARCLSRSHYLSLDITHTHTLSSSHSLSIIHPYTHIHPVCVYVFLFLPSTPAAPRDRFPWCSYEVGISLVLLLDLVIIVLIK